MGAADERDCLLTLVERSSGVALVAKLPNRTAKTANRATLRLIRTSGMPFKTITWDNGTEFHGYKALEKKAGIRCYFAYPIGRNPPRRLSRQECCEALHCTDETMARSSSLSCASSRRLHSIRADKHPKVS